MDSILVYHTIDQAEGQAPCPERISPERFEQQLHWLARRRRVVPLIDTLANNRRRSSVSITFDDGYRDNLIVALPLLEKYSMPMTMFMAAGFVDRDNYLSQDELREISRHPLITVGSHGFYHRNFNELSVKEARFELRESRRTLENITGRKVTLLAWPYGECSPATEHLSAACGYDASWSVWKGTNSRHSRWRVPLGSRDNLMRFIAKASGVYGLTEARLHRFEERRRGRRLNQARPSTPVLAGANHQN